MRKLIFYISLCTLLSSNFLVAQPTLDSLENLAMNIEDDSLKFDLYNQLRRLTINSDPKIAEEFTFKMIEAAQGWGNKKKEMIGQVYLGTSYYSLGQYEKALDAFVLAEGHFSQTEDTIILANIYNGMAAAYENSGNDTIVLSYFTKAYHLFKEKGDDRRSGLALNNMGNIYVARKDYDTAIIHISEAAELMENTKSSRYWSTVNLNLAIVYSEAGFLEKAEEVFNKILPYLSEEEDAYNYMNWNKGLGSNFLFNNEYSKAIPLLEKAKKVSIQNNFNVDRPDILFELSKAFEGGKIWDKALENLHLHIAFKDSIFSIEKDKNLSNSLQKYEAEKREKELAQTQLELERESLRKSFFFIATLAAIILALIAFWLLYFVSKTNKKLTEQKSIIQQNLNEKELLLNEIHHRVKNNLQVVSSLLSLQSRTLEDEKAKAAIGEGQNRIKSMALIHQSLYATGNAKGMNIDEYIGKLSQNLFHSYNINPDKIEFVNKAEKIPLDVDTLIPLGLILNELISNTLKHAFPNDAAGKVTVVFRKKDNHLELKVEDNGVGIVDEERNTIKKSFGMSLVKAFVNKLDANMTITQANGLSVQILINNFTIASPK